MKEAAMRVLKTGLRLGIPVKPQYFPALLLGSEIGAVFITGAASHQIRQRIHQKLFSGLPHTRVSDSYTG